MYVCYVSPLLVYKVTNANEASILFEPEKELSKKERSPVLGLWLQINQLAIHSQFINQRGYLMCGKGCR